MGATTRPGRRAKTRIKGKYFELTAQGSPEFIARVMKALTELNLDAPTPDTHPATTGDEHEPRR